MRPHAIRAVLLLPVALWPLFSQKPVINPRGVVNAASLAPIDQDGFGNGNPIAAGSIATVFGSNLARETKSADTVPLPTVLGGISVLVGGRGIEIAAPLYYVSPTQINFQVPAIGLSTVVISRDGLRSDPVQVWGTLQEGLGIFTLDGSGCGRAVVANVGADGSWSLNSSSNSAVPGQQIVVLANGLGGETLPPDGQPTPLSPLYPAYPGSVYSQAYYVGGLFDGKGTGTVFSGKAPGMIGVDQVNLRIPSDAVTGCAVPLQLIYSSNGAVTLGDASQRVPISVNLGGGQCADPKPNVLAELTWVKTVSDMDPATTPDALRAKFVMGIGKQFDIPQRASPTTGGSIGGGVFAPVFQTARVCTGFDSYDGLPVNPGVLSLQFPGGAQTFTPTETAMTYVVPLAAGTIHEGSYTVASAGSSVVGPFQTSTNIPPPFQLKTQFSSGMTLKLPFSLDWTPGDSNSLVRFLILTHPTRNFENYAFDVAAQASAGHVDISAPSGIPLFSETADLVISMSSEGNQVQSFSAPGLTQPGRHGWSYEYRYKNVKVIAPIAR